MKNTENNVTEEQQGGGSENIEMILEKKPEKQKKSSVSRFLITVFCSAIFLCSALLGVVVYFELDTGLKEFFENDLHYLILEMVDYEHTIVYQDCKDAADILRVPLYERVAFPHLSGDPDNPVVTQVEVPVGYLHLNITDFYL